MPYTAQSLADAIRALMQVEPTTKASLDAWYNEARHVQDELAASSDLPISDGIWEGLMHYLIDADIRVKDPRYSEMQRANSISVGTVSTPRRSTRYNLTWSISMWLVWDISPIEALSEVWA